jgi:hypothetical protein
LPVEQQAKIRELVDKAGALSARQRDRLQLLFRGAADEATCEAPQ